jgi:mono/diheme cytochrome c family protein
MRKLAFVLSALFLSAGVATADEGEKQFKSKCASCHGADGKGKTKQGEKMKIGDMTSAAFKKEFPVEKIIAVVNEGVKREKDGVHQEMKPLKGKMTDEQIAETAKHVAGLK